MSVLLDLSIFPLDQGVSVSRFVAPVVAMIRDSGHDYRLSAMRTIVETGTLEESLELIERAQGIMDALGCERMYVTARFDIRRGPLGRVSGRITSVRQQIGEVET